MHASGIVELDVEYSFGGATGWQAAQPTKRGASIARLAASQVIGLGIWVRAALPAGPAWVSGSVIVRTGSGWSARAYATIDVMSASRSAITSCDARRVRYHR
jgi:hypothetical protein